MQEQMATTAAHKRAMSMLNADEWHARRRIILAACRADRTERALAWREAERMRLACMPIA